MFNQVRSAARGVLEICVIAPLVGIGMLVAAALLASIGFLVLMATAALPLFMDDENYQHALYQS